MKYPPILFFAFANDKAYGGGFLKELDKERREIERILTPNKNCEVQVRTDASKKRILAILDKYKSAIKIFHFSGHAAETGIELETYNGESKEALVEGLAPYIAEQKGVRLVFLNGCSTQGQVKSFHKAGIPAVIATTHPVHDHVASEFAQEFYKNLGLGKNILKAFQDSENSLLIDYQPKDLYQDRAMNWKGNDKDSKYPYDLYLKPGQEHVQEESLETWYQSYEAEYEGSGQEQQLIPHDDYLLCDRTRANSFFGKHFNPSIKKPKIFLIHAPNEEKSDSLVQRFLIHSVDPLIDKNRDLIKDLINVDFPEASDFEHEDVSWAMNTLLQNFDNVLRIRSKDISARNIIDKKTYKDVLFIQHLIMAESWHKAMPGFIMQNYLNFWNIELRDKDPEVLILFNVVYTAEKNVFTKLFGGKDKTIETDLKRIASHKPEITLLEKLAPVSKEAVVKWQKLRCSNLSDISKELYGKKNIQPMELVQQHLIEVTEEFNKRKISIQKSL